MNHLFLSRGHDEGFKMILHIVTTLRIIVKIEPKIYKFSILSRKILLYLVFVLHKVINI